MFNQADFTVAIEQAIPVLRKPLHLPECERSIYKQVDVLAHYISDKACENELHAAKRALCLTDHLYQEGNAAVKNAIEAVFVFSLSSTLTRLGNKRTYLLGLLPVTLFTLYMNQVLHKGC